VKSLLISNSTSNSTPAEDDSRPPLPDGSRFNTQGLQDILRACWSTKPSQRPTFSKLVEDFTQLRKGSGQGIIESPGIQVIDEVSDSDRTASPSPDMRPTCLPDYVQPVDNDLGKLFFLQLRFPSYLWHLLIPPKSGRSSTRVG
jgi:hypothetical protein